MTASTTTLTFRQSATAHTAKPDVIWPDEALTLHKNNNHSRTRVCITYCHRFCSQIHDQPDRQNLHQNHWRSQQNRDNHPTHHFSCDTDKLCMLTMKSVRGRVNSNRYAGEDAHPQSFLLYGLAIVSKNGQPSSNGGEKQPILILNYANLL
jgi:hypothetical protein